MQHLLAILTQSIEMFCSNGFPNKTLFLNPHCV